MHIDCARTTGSWLMHVGGIRWAGRGRGATVIQQMCIAQGATLPAHDLCIADPGMPRVAGKP